MYSNYSLLYVQRFYHTIGHYTNDRRRSNCENSSETLRCGVEKEAVPPHHKILEFSSWKCNILVHFITILSNHYLWPLAHWRHHRRHAPAPSSLELYALA